MDALASCALRAPQHGGDLPVREVVDEPEGHGHALAVRQPAHGLPELVVGLGTRPAGRSGTVEGHGPGATSVVTVPGFAMAQQGVFQMITSVLPADQLQQDFYVTWTSNAPLFVYGSVVDNKTGDSVLIQ